jgi:diacylglycerol kinase family enzyme
VEAVDTEQQGHATHISREAVDEGYEVVVAFGGDGTINEAANGLAGSGVPLTCLPGGATNVYCRTLGIPGDVVDATEHLLALADGFQPREVDLGRVEDRFFAYASGVGLDASVVERVDSNPALKRRFGEYYYTYASVSTFARRYLVDPPRVRVEVDGESVEGVTCIVQNSDPYTYFGDRPIRVCEGAGFHTGTLGLTVLRRATALELPTLLPRVFSGRAEKVAAHRHVTAFTDVGGALVSSIDGRAFPVQVDGDYIGRFESVRYSVARRALTVVS